MTENRHADIKGCKFIVNVFLLICKHWQFLIKVPVIVLLTKRCFIWSYYVGTPHHPHRILLPPLRLRILRLKLAPLGSAWLS